MVNKTRHSSSFRPIAMTGSQASKLVTSANKPYKTLLFIKLLQHRHLDAMSLGGFDGDLVSRVGVPDNAHAGIRCQHP